MNIDASDQLEEEKLSNEERHFLPKADPKQNLLFASVQFYSFFRMLFTVYERLKYSDLLIKKEVDSKY